MSDNLIAAAERRIHECKERMAALLLLLAELDPSHAPGTITAVTAEIRHIVEDVGATQALLTNVRHEL